MSIFFKYLFADPAFRVYSCDCPEEWTGPSCEFESEIQNQEFEECTGTLVCLNGGQCRKGAPATPFDDAPSLAALATDETNEIGDERCVCPRGYMGSRCEHEYEECGGGIHLCLHGTKCVPPKGAMNPSWTCECDESSPGFCQHHRTTTCTTSDSANMIYQGLQSVAYCVNDGVCMEYVQDGKR